MLHILDKQNTIINKFLAELRNIDVHIDKRRRRHSALCAERRTADKASYLVRRSFADGARANSW